ncbi:hypothetical protein, partial [Klebsiella grimontii]
MKTLLTSGCTNQRGAGHKALVAEINKLTQEAVNPSGRRLEFEMHGERFFQNLRLNDAILFTQNHYDKGIQNGSLGTLTSIDSSGESYGVVTLDTGDKVEVTQSVLDCMELGYAITLHKAQGSQFPRIIIALQKGKRHCCKVSDEAAFCLIQRPYISKTLLTRRISPR